MENNTENNIGITAEEQNTEQQNTYVLKRGRMPNKHEVRTANQAVCEVEIDSVRCDAIAAKMQQSKNVEKTTSVVGEEFDSKPDAIKNESRSKGRRNYDGRSDDKEYLNKTKRNECNNEKFSEEDSNCCNKHKSYKKNKTHEYTCSDGCCSFFCSIKKFFARLFKKKTQQTNQKHHSYNRSRYSRSRNTRDQKSIKN